jgi:PAS domain S-box-containing protein
MDGYRFCYEVRKSEEHRDLPIIIYTATYTSPSDEKLSLELGADKYLRKPASVVQILDALHDATAGKHVVPKAQFDERDVLKHYSERLIYKLEEKNVELNVRNLELGQLNNRLEAEILERKKAHAELDRLRRRDKAILNSAGEGIYSVDLSGNIIFVNPKAADLLGWSATELQGKAAHAAIYHTDPQGSDHSIEACPICACVSEDASRRVTNDVFWRKDGSSFRVDYVAAPTKDEEGHITGSIVTFRDITEQSQSPTRLKRQEQQYRLLFEMNPNPTWVLDATTLRILAVNQVACALYGYSQSEFLELNLNDLRPAEDAPDRLKTGALLSSQPISHYYGQFRHIRKNGSTIVVEIYSGGIVWEGWNARIVTAVDVTDRNRME